MGEGRRGSEKEGEVERGMGLEGGWGGRGGGVERKGGRAKESEKKRSGDWRLGDSLSRRSILAPFLGALSWRPFFSPFLRALSSRPFAPGRPSRPR